MWQRSESYYFHGRRSRANANPQSGSRNSSRIVVREIHCWSLLAHLPRTARPTPVSSVLQRRLPVSLFLFSSSFLCSNVQALAAGGYYGSSRRGPWGPLVARDYSAGPPQALVRTVFLASFALSAKAQRGISWSTPHLICRPLVQHLSSATPERQSDITFFQILEYRKNSCWLCASRNRENSLRHCSHLSRGSRGANV